jgi:Family of unknown function (DUF6511)
MVERCYICHRHGRGHGFAQKEFAGKGKPQKVTMVWFCGKLCADIFYHKYKKGIPMKLDLLTTEQNALQYAGNEGGQYLESIGKTDLATLTPDEWNMFLYAVVCTFCGQLQEMEKAGTPF